MTLEWNELANGERWHGVVSFIRNWVGAFGPDHGISREKLGAILRAKSLTLPNAVCEWYQLATNWTQGGMNVWVHPRELMAYDGIIDVLYDAGGVNEWSIRVADIENNDPPVVSDNKIASPSFSQFVAAIIINDVLFGDVTEEALELNRGVARAEGMRVVASCCGDFIADGPLESAAVVMYVYPRNGPVLGKSRTPKGGALLSRLRKR